MDYKQEQFMRMQQYQYAPHMPFYMSYPIQNVYMTEMEYERDMERMKELYPEEAKRIQKLVEEECDKMEYEGSMMFDEYPDRVTLKVICERIYQLASQPQEQAEAELAAEQAEPVDYRWNHGGPPGSGWPGPGRPPGPPPPGWPPGPPSPGWPPGPPPGRPPGPPPGRPPSHNPGLGNLIEVLLYNEMYKRRCRHNRCRRWW